MKFAAIIDIAAFIWDEGQFAQDQSLFYPMIDSMPAILNLIIRERIPVVFRSELFEEVKTHFPHNLVPNQYRDFHRTTLGQLSKLNMIGYLSTANANITCKPSLVRHYFANTSQQEITHLINHLYNENERIQKLLTFRIIWPQDADIVIRNGNTKKVATQICDDKNNHTTIIRSLKKIFEHNPKHRAVKRFFRGREIASFRFYDPRINDSRKAQLLLDNSVNIRGSYYSKDVDTGIYVRFLKTEKNLFHGFEIVPSYILKEQIEIGLQNG